MLQSLQACRAAAAILVVLYHINDTLRLPKYLGVEPFGPIFQCGFVSLDFFFVLSGFIIMYVHARDIGQPGEFRGYLWKRLSRAYPPYWVVLAVIVPIFLLIPQFGVGFERDPGVIVRSILLFPDPASHTILVVAWTMVYEVLFYLLFGVLVLNKRLGMLIFLGWAAVVLAFPGFESYPWNFLFSPWHVRTLAGVGAALLLQRCRIPMPRTVAGVGVGLFLLTSNAHAFYGPLSPVILTLGCTLGCAMTIVGLGEAERSGSIQAPRALVYLGNAAYAIYLIHFPAISLLAKLTRVSGMDTHVPGTILFLLHLIVALCLGCVFHHWIENPLHRWSRRFLRRPAGTAVVEVDGERPVRRAA